MLLRLTAVLFVLSLARLHVEASVDADTVAPEGSCPVGDEGCLGARMACADGRIEMQYSRDKSVVVFDAFIAAPRLVALVLPATVEHKRMHTMDRGKVPKSFNIDRALQLGELTSPPHRLACRFSGVSGSDSDATVAATAAFLDDKSHHAHSTAIHCVPPEEIWSQWLTGAQRLVTLEINDDPTLSVGPFPLCIPREVLNSTQPSQTAPQHKLVVCSSPLITLRRQGGEFFTDANHFSALWHWIEHNRQIGVEHFYLYDVSALTGNRAMNSHHRTILERLISLGVVTHIPFGQWSKDGFEQMNSFQEVAQQHCVQKYGQATEWIGMYDPDEMWIPLRKKERTVIPFLNEIKETKPNIGEVWASPVNYGVCDYERKMGGSVFDRCTKSTVFNPDNEKGEAERPSTRGVYTKYFMRPELVLGPGVHKVLLFKSPQTLTYEIPKERIRLNHYISTFYKRAYVQPSMKLVTDPIARELFGKDLKRRMKVLGDPIVKHKKK